MERPRGALFHIDPLPPGETLWDLPVLFLGGVWAVLRNNLAWLWSPVIQSNINLGVAVKAFSKVKKIF